jgi:creatinine amidohydrolase
VRSAQTYKQKQQQPTAGRRRGRPPPLFFWDLGGLLDPVEQRQKQLLSTIIHRTLSIAKIPKIPNKSCCCPQSILTSDRLPYVTDHRNEDLLRISDMNWMQVEEYLTHDDRAVLPIGSTEQHSHLSLSVDSILAERVAVEAAESMNVPVFPVLSYGVTPYFLAFPGTVSLTVTTHLAVVRDILDSLAHSGFRRILIVNGHGGNNAVQQLAQEWLIGRPECRLVFHNWWNAPLTGVKVREIDPNASHASWMENFPWTRLANVTMPEKAQPMLDTTRIRALDPVGVRKYIGDGNFGGRYQRSDDDMLAIWKVAVDETRALIDAL